MFEPDHFHKNYATGETAFLLLVGLRGPGGNALSWDGVPKMQLTKPVRGKS